jgi:hypothetical protein
VTSVPFTCKSASDFISTTTDGIHVSPNSAHETLLDIFTRLDMNVDVTNMASLQEGNELKVLHATDVGTRTSGKSIDVTTNLNAIDVQDQGTTTQPAP